MWLAQKASLGTIGPLATIFSVVFCFLSLGSAATQAAQEDDLHKAAIEQIIDCIKNAKEAVLLPREVRCVSQQGANLIKTETLRELDLAAVCQDQQDWRTLPAGTIKTIAGRQPSIVDPRGIRIMGAIFCDPLDLAGLELNYSLVLDKSILLQGAMARNFRTHGDLSFDESLILGPLRLVRSQVGGSVYAEDSLISRLEILDTTVQGSLLFKGTLFVQPAVFDTVSLAGELRLREAAFPYVIVQFSKIGGVLDLTKSQARCAYHIRKSEISDLVAVDLGFGASYIAPDSSLAFDWRDTGKIASRLEAAKKAPTCERLRLEPGCSVELTRDAVDDKSCAYSAISSEPGTFLISDTRMKSSFCLRSLHWLAPQPGQELAFQSGRGRSSFITLRDINVGTSASIDLAPENPGNSASGSHNLQILGLEANALLFNFDRSRKNIPPYKLSLSGLKFDHIYAAEAFKCDYNPDFFSRDSAAAAGSPTPRLESASDPGARLRVPHVDEVMSWLEGNSLLTTQPFAAFVDVFQKHGDDKDAKQLRVAKASAELCVKAERIFGQYVNWICTERGQATAPGEEQDTAAKVAASATSSPIGRAIELGNDLAALFFGTLLSVIADHGYRPEKVGWFVLVTIGIFWLYFWGKLRIVGFTPKEKDVLLPIGLIFLFDRLLPAYHIREDHYQIGSFYRRVNSRTQGARKMRYLHTDIAVVQASDAQNEHAQRSLDVIKVIGLILAVFLVAAINALVSR